MDVNPPPSTNQTALKGVLIVLALIAAGAFLLARGLNDDSPQTATTAATPTPTTSPSGSTQAPETPQTPATNGETTPANPPTTGETSPPPVAPATPPPASAGDGDSSNSTDDDPNALLECRDPSTIQVLVANGTNVQGAATRLTGELNASNYVTLQPANTRDNQIASSSAFYYRAGYEVDARCIAQVAGVSAGPFFVMPDPPPGAIPRDRLGNAFVLVIIGSDALAQRLGG
ncbi:MAG: LytR C-terminal domain-containing protein [bacterium]|nr:LytR C-terminal domain-containing protein [bacterium]